jgi:DNA-binding transcriptional MerR regulator
VKVSELSRTSGVSVPTIKYYLREGLLPPGEATSAPNQADYGDGHARRLRLIQVLTQLGGLTVARTRDVLAAIENERLPVAQLLSVVQRAMAPEPADPSAPGVAEARAEVVSYLRRRRWGLPDDLPGVEVLARALAALRDLGRDVDVEVLRPYADLADVLAKREVATIPADAARAEAVEAMVVGTVVFEAVFDALRRLAHARHAARRFP